MHPELLRFVNELHIGVSMFFVLSGFLIAFTYADKPIQSPSSYFKYLLVRVARIFPLYWLILLALEIDPKFSSIKHPVLTASLLHGFSSKLNLNGLAQAWSLNVEMTFYILAPFLFLLKRKSWLLLFASLIALLLMSIGVGELWKIWNSNPLNFFLPVKFILGSTFPGRFIEFIAGMGLAQLISQNHRLLLIPNKTLTGIAGVIVSCYAMGLFQPDIFHHGSDHPAGWLIHTLILPIFVVLLYAGLITESTKIQHFLQSKTMTLLGNASFAFYLIHISYVNIKIRNYHLMPDRNFTLLWLLSIILYLAFEKPIYQLCKKSFRK